MAKVTELPIAAALAGDEETIIIQGGEVKRAPFSLPSAGSTRFGSVQFPHENGFSATPARNGELRLPGSQTGLATLGTASLWDGAASALFFMDVGHEFQDAQNQSPAIFAADLGTSTGSPRIFRAGYATAYHSDGTVRRRIVFYARGENATTLWTITSAPLAAGRYAVLIFNDGANGFCHCLNIDSGVWTDGAAVARPASWAGIPLLRGNLQIGGAYSGAWPVAAPGLFGGSQFRGALADLLFANAALSKANVEAIVAGANPVAIATAAGATKYLYIPLARAGALDLAVETTQAGMDDGLTAFGTLLPGPDFRRQAQASFLTLRRLAWPAMFPIPNNAAAAPVQLSGLTDLVGGVWQFRCVANDGRELTPWVPFRATVSAGAWQGTVFIPESVREAFQLQIRNTSAPDAVAASHSRCFLSYAVDFEGQSEAYIASLAFRRSMDSTGLLGIPSAADTDSVVFAHVAADTGYEVLPFLGSIRDRPQWLGETAMVIANIVAARAGRPVMIRIHALSGTSMLSLMNDADASRSWARNQSIWNLTANRGERGEVISNGYVIFGWEAAMSGGDVIANAYRPFLTGIGSGPTSSTQIAQADIDHFLRDGEISQDAPVVIVPCNRASIARASATATDASAEADQRDNFRNWAHLLGYQIGPENTAHMLEGETAAGGLLPTSSQTHPEPGVWEGAVETAVIAAEAILMALGKSTYSGAVFFERIRAGSAANKVIVTLGDPRPYPGAGLAAGATGYSTAQQTVAASFINLHTKREGGDPGAGFEAQIDGGAWSKANVISGAIIAPREVELTLSAAPAASVQVRHVPGSPGSYSSATISQAAWRAGRLYFTGKAYPAGGPTSFADLINLGWLVAGSNQPLVLNL